MKSPAEKAMQVTVGKYSDHTKSAVLGILSAIVAFMLSNTVIFLEYAPFGVAFIAALPKKYILAGGAGAVIGYMFGLHTIDTTFYISAVIIAAAVKWVLSAMSKGKSAAISVAAAFFGISVVAVATTISGYFAGIDFLMQIALALLGAALSYFFYKSFEAVKRSGNLLSLANSEVTAIIIALSILLLSFSHFEVLSVSPARVLAVIIIMAAALNAREYGGAIAGVAMGFAMSLAYGDYLFIAASYAFAGLISAIFARLGKFSLAAVFIIAHGVISIRVGATDEVISSVIEVTAAGVIFILLPRVIHLRLHKFFTFKKPGKKADGLRRAVCMKLRNTSGAIADVSSTIDEVSSRLQRVSAPSFNQIYLNVEADACKNCALRMHCFETNSAETLKYLSDMIGVVRRHGKITIDDINADFAGRCARPTAIAESVFKHFSSYQNKEAANRRIDEVRTVITHQFNSIGEMLKGMSYEFLSTARFDFNSVTKVESALLSGGITAEDVTAILDEFGRLTVEIRLNNDAERINKGVLMRELSHICERDFDVPIVSKLQDSYLIVLHERAALKVESGIAQFSVSDTGLSGDYGETFVAANSKSYAILSDGMGTGGRAAVDSAMAAGLMARLIKAGFNLGSALKMVNSAMLFKSTDESLATLDIAEIDLFSGELTLSKAGAAATIIKKDGASGKAHSSSMPIGILSDVEFDSAQISLKAGDVVLMLSDGATDAGTDWIIEELDNFRDDSAQRLAEIIASGARRRRENMRLDDITVMAMIVERNA